MTPKIKVMTVVNSPRHHKEGCSSNKARQITCKAGKACNGNEKKTATEYAN